MQGRKRVAIIGAGISGMAAALRLAHDHDVTLYEAEGRIGGHARTRMAGPRGDQPVDTGFIVFNYATYPHLTALFAELDVPVTPSNMSFGASFRGGALDYGLADLGTLFAQRGNLEIAKLLLAKGADPNMKDRSGASALSLATGKGNKAMVELLSSAAK